ncbi:MAG: radical SAM protein [Deltaproteobacteria bacterium]|nr:radical SAM protein [Deltaproteobacteria bacterium]
MLKVISKLSINKVASTYIAYIRNSRKNLIEFVDSTPPPNYDRKKKWVIIISSQIGCSLKCKFCDAPKHFLGNLTPEELISQVFYIVNNNHAVDPNKVDKFKIQFARMGEPSLNMATLEAMVKFKKFYPSYIPCIATTAPLGSEKFFAHLLNIKDIFHDFQLQFSINSTDPTIRDKIMPFKKLPLKWIANYSEKFYRKGKRKVVLNFAISDNTELDYKLIRNTFNPDTTIIKLTPINPTTSALRNGFRIDNDYDKIHTYLRKHSISLQRHGFQSIISIGDMRENTILSNCGQIANVLLSNSQLQM